MCIPDESGQAPISLRSMSDPVVVKNICWEGGGIDY